MDISDWLVTRDSLHALRSLPGDVDEFDHLELGLDDVQVVVEAGALAPLGHDGQLRIGGVAHEQQDVDVAGFPEEDSSPGGGVRIKCILSSVGWDNNNQKLMLVPIIIKPCTRFKKLWDTVYIFFHYPRLHVTLFLFPAKSDSNIREITQKLFYNRESQEALMF